MSRDSMNVLSRLESELADDEDDEADDEADEDDDELDPVELAADGLMFVDGEVFNCLDEDDPVEAAIAARINGALMTVSTLDARK